MAAMGATSVRVARAESSTASTTQATSTSTAQGRKSVSKPHSVRWEAARRSTSPSESRRVWYTISSERVLEVRVTVAEPLARASWISSRSPWFSMEAAPA